MHEWITPPLSAFLASARAAGQQRTTSALPDGCKRRRGGQREHQRQHERGAHRRPHLLLPGAFDSAAGEDNENRSNSHSGLGQALISRLHPIVSESIVHQAVYSLQYMSDSDALTTGRAVIHAPECRHCIESYRPGTSLRIPRCADATSCPGRTRGRHALARAHAREHAARVPWCVTARGVGGAPGQPRRRSADL